MQTTVYFDIGKEKFLCTGKILTDPGYTSVMTWQAISDDEDIPPFTKGQTCNIADVCETLYLVSFVLLLI